MKTFERRVFIIIVFIALIALAAFATVATYNSYQTEREAVAFRQALENERQMGQVRATEAFQKWSQTTFDSNSGAALEWRGKDSEIIYIWSTSDITGAWSASSVNETLPVYSIIAKSPGGRYFKVQVYLADRPPFVWGVPNYPEQMTEAEVVKELAQRNRVDLLGKFNLPKTPA